MSTRMNKGVLPFPSTLMIVLAIEFCISKREPVPQFDTNRRFTQNKKHLHRRNGLFATTPVEVLPFFSEAIRDLANHNKGMVDAELRHQVDKLGDTLTMKES